MFFGNMLSNSSWRYLIQLQVLISELLLTSHCLTLNLLATNLVPLCIDSPNIFFCRNILLYRDLLFSSSEDTLCIKEGLTIPLQSLPPFAEAFETIWKSIPPSLLAGITSSP